MKNKIILAFSVVMMTSTAAMAQDKIALVIANSAYRMIPAAETAHRHALAMVEGLEANGFEVTVVHNSTLAFYNFTLNSFKTRLKAAAPGSVGVVYFAGHGLSQDGTNYLLPIDLTPVGADSLATNAIDAASLTVDLGADTSKQSYVVIDCCTANQLDPSEAGMVEMAAPANNRIVFAAPAGEVLAVGDTFTQDLVAALSAPEATIATALDAVDPTVTDLTAPVEELPVAEAEVVEPEVVVEAAPEVAEDASPEVDTEETVAQAPQETDPVVEEERAAWDALQGAAGSSELLAFLSAYPDGVFADDAKDMLVQVLAAQQSAAAVAVPVEDITAPDSDVVAAIAAVAPPETPAADPVIVTFSTPLLQGDPAVVGKTIEELIKGMPLFPPVEGLPESFWKDQTCSSCHEWEEVNLCDQANTYLTEAGSVNLTKPHPYGGTFKQNIRDWALGGCTP